MRLTIALIGLVLLAACGGGGGGAPRTAPPPEQPPEQPTYERAGAIYMPTVTDSVMTYEVTEFPAKLPTGGGDSSGRWYEPCERSFRRRSIETEELGNQLAMFPEPEEERAFTSPLFSGTRLLGFATRGPWGGGLNEESPAFVQESFTEPLLILPDTLPDIGGQWVVTSDLKDTDLYGVLRVSFRVNARLQALEDVSTVAGDFENTIRVVYTGEIVLNTWVAWVAPESVYSTLQVPGSATVWFAPHVGPVKGVAESALAGQVEIVLLSVE